MFIEPIDSAAVEELVSDEIRIMQSPTFVHAMTGNGGPDLYSDKPAWLDQILQVTATNKA